MMKFKDYLKLVIIATVSLYSFEGNAQFRVFATPSFEIPIVFGNNSGYNPTFGFKIGGFYEARRFSLGLSVGYQSFSSNEDDGTKAGLYSFLLDDDPSGSSSSFLAQHHFLEKEIVIPVHMQRSLEI